MNTTPEVEVDLEKLFQPSWAQETPSAIRYAKFTGNEDHTGERKREGRRDSRGPRRDGPPGGGGRPGGAGRPGGGAGFGARPQRRDGARPGGPQGGGRRDDQRGPRRDGPREVAPPLPLPEINLTLVPDENGVDSLARQIKMTGRAFPLFEIARVVLQRAERYAIKFSVKKKADGQPAQPLFVCALDDTLWLGEDEVVEHVLRNHFGTFYQAERTATEPPKGVYTFVGQCGMSGEILGPPNYHGYQEQLRKLHTEKFSRMPFDMFKARVKIVRDEAVVKKWVEDQSWKTEFNCLNVPEPLKLASKEEVEKHFRATHKDTIIKPVEQHRLSGVTARGMRCRDLARLVRQVAEDQQRFPLQIATTLSQEFAKHGLQFFKVNKTVTHVAVARPSYLDLETTPVSSGVKAIVEFINTHPKCTRRKLIEALAPSPKPAPAPVAVPVEGAAPDAAPAKPVAPDPTPEQTAVLSDLHWLVHQGHVIEFANGLMDTAKKPLPRPAKPAAKPAATAAAGSAEPEIPAVAAQAEGEVSAGEAVTTEISTVSEAPAAEAESPAPAAEEAPAVS